MKHGKHYVDAAKLVDSTKAYDVNEALELACKTASAKFDETVELHVRLGVDGRHADQQVRGAVVLPNGTGKAVQNAEQEVERAEPVHGQLAKGNDGFVPGEQVQDEVLSGQQSRAGAQGVKDADA